MPKFATTLAWDVGWQNDKLLLIERKKFPFGFAPPAGHVDGDADFITRLSENCKKKSAWKRLSLNY